MNERGTALFGAAYASPLRKCGAPHRSHPARSRPRPNRRNPLSPDLGLLEADRCEFDLKMGQQSLEVGAPPRATTLDDERNVEPGQPGSTQIGKERQHVAREAVDLLRALLVRADEVENEVAYPGLVESADARGNLLGAAERGIALGGAAEIHRITVA